jgi:hypothetical protein
MGIVFGALVLVGLMAMVLISLLRGLNAFRHSLDEENWTGTGPSPLQMKQNQMMFARVKYQALAIGVIFLIGMMAAH